MQMSQSHIHSISLFGMMTLCVIFFSGCGCSESSDVNESPAVTTNSGTAANSTPSNSKDANQTEKGDNATPDATTLSDGEQITADPSQAEIDAKYREQIVGDWKGYRDGWRMLTVRDDGTATMDVSIEGLSRFVFGDKIVFEIEWEIKDGDLVFETTGGSPQWAVDKVTLIYGKSRVQPILKLTETEMSLKDADEGDPDHEYERVVKESNEIRSAPADGQLNAAE